MAIDKIAQDRAATLPGPVAQLSVPKLVAFHLIPGALVTVAFVMFAPLVRAAGFPPIAALLAAILLVLVPVELGVVLRTARRDGSPWRCPIASGSEHASGSGCSPS